MFKPLENFKGTLPEGNRFDIFSAEASPISLHPIFDIPTRRLVRTGLEVQLPEGMGVFIQSVPGLWHCYGVSIEPFMLTKESFGELKVVISNFSDKNFNVFPGDRIAEGIIVRLGG